MDIVTSESFSIASTHYGPMSLSPSLLTDHIDSDAVEEELTTSESASIASTDYGPRSLSPSSRTSRSLERARAAVEYKSTTPNRRSSNSSNCSNPRSLSPSVRTSMYAVDLIKGYQEHPSLTLKDHEYRNRSVVTSMRDIGSKSGISGYHFDQVDVDSNHPDGKGVRCCHNGKLSDGKWPMGKLLRVDSTSNSLNRDTCSKLRMSGHRFDQVDVNSNHPGGRDILWCDGGRLSDGKWPMGKLLRGDSTSKSLNYSSSTCDTSICSSLSDSITPNILATFGKIPKTKVRKSIKPPKFINIPNIHQRTDWREVEVYFHENQTKRVVFMF